MDIVQVSTRDDITTVVMNRGKVNALNEAMVDRLQKVFDELEASPETRAVILTGAGKFFSFGLDVPELYDYSPEDFALFLRKFTGLYAHLFVFPKPVIAAVNGHAIAGGCMLATSCDYRFMVPGRAKISLNEITFGSSVFAGSVEMLKFRVGSSNAQRVLYDGSMYTAEEAKTIGLVDRVVTEEDLLDQAATAARQLISRNARAFAAIKGLLRNPVADVMRRNEAASIEKFVRIWYSEETRESLKSVQIR